MSDESKKEVEAKIFNEEEIKYAIDVARKGMQQRANNREQYLNAINKIEAEMQQLNGQVVGFEALLKGSFQKKLDEEKKKVVSIVKAEDEKKEEEPKDKK